MSNRAAAGGRSVAGAAAPTETVACQVPWATVTMPKPQLAR